MVFPLLITLGDPNGLGPELVVRLLADKIPDRPLVLLGPEQALEVHCHRRGIDCFWRSLPAPLCLSGLPPGIYGHTPPELISFWPAVGESQLDGGRAAGVSLELASWLLHVGASKGVVTLPLSKALFKAAGYNFSGHTEFLATMAGLDPDAVCMHLCGPMLRVSLVTTHPPLAKVTELITYERILRSLDLTGHFVIRLGIKPATIAVCGLNPHAGEHGTIGREELEIIAPAIATARANGVDAVGPFPADTLFHRAVHGEFAAVLAMYHDQGLGPLKLLHFKQTVNVTLGLPFVRTSVDHGTGFDLAGRDVADISSFAAALDMAQELCDSEGHRSHL
ncbi:4-hydroxythreonine-4-phosphate dehydrogenase [Desulfovibrionales bacterium]